MFTENDKRKLGVVFEYLRKKKSKAVEETCKNICSIKVYRDVIKGKGKKDIYYEDLIESFGYDLVSFDSLNNWLNDIIECFYDACDYMDDRKICELYKEVQDYFKDKTQYILYQQYNLLFGYLFRYYKDDHYLNKDEIYDVLSLMNLAEEKLKVLLIEIMDLSNWNYIGDYQLFKPIFKWIEQYKDNMIVMYHYALEQEIQQNLSDSLDVLNDLIIQLSLRHNDYRSSKVLLGLYAIYKNINYKKAEELLPKLLELSYSNNLSNKMKHGIFYNIANNYYMRKEFEAASKYFQKSLNYAFDENALLFLSSCCCELEIDLPNELENYISNNTAASVYLKYYVNKKKGIYEQFLEEYIMGFIMDQLSKEIYYEPYWGMFERELNRLVAKTRNYSLLHHYKKKRDKFKIK